MDEEKLFQQMRRSWQDAFCAYPGLGKMEASDFGLHEGENRGLPILCEKSGPVRQKPLTSPVQEILGVSYLFKYNVVYFS